jgi:hypothetical protein
LAAHGFNCEELITNIFTAYIAVKDEEFLQLVRLHYFQYEQGQGAGDPDKVMQSMEAHYHKRIIDGTWNPKIDKSDKDRIIALETMIAELEKGSGKNQGQNKGNDSINAK